MRCHLGCRSGPQALAVGRIGKHGVQLAREFVNIVHFEEQPILGVINQLGIAPNARRNDTATARHRLHQRIGKRLSAGR